MGLPSLPPSGFIGRSQELAFVLSTVEHFTTRLLTIIGPGGVGKTRLALTAGWGLTASFPDGVYFIQFTTTDPEHVWEQVALQLRITNADGGSWFATLRETLRDRKLLLILDNCEHVTEAFVDLPEILGACPGVMVIATSQEALHLQGEQELWLQPLTLPPGDQQVTLSEVSDSCAVVLFALRARMVNPSFELTETNAQDIAAIVHLLDGLPLTIELAAAQTRHLSPSALRQRLECALASLSGGPRDVPERQQSLMKMAEWSLSLLSADDRNRFLQLSVMVGDFSEEAAFAIMGVRSPVEGWERLLAFADKSLIKRVVGTGEETPRFFMLQTVHAVALHLLKQRPDLYLAACERHANACLTLARQAEAHWHDTEQLDWLRRIELDHANFQLVLERALTEPKLIYAALALTEPMFWFWYTRGYHKWALPTVEQLLERAPDDIPSRIRGAAHVTAGWLAYKQSQVDRAEWHFREGIWLLPDATSSFGLQGSIGLAYATKLGKNATEASAELQDVLNRCQNRTDVWHDRAGGYFGLGLINLYDQQPGPARAYFEESLKISRSHQDHLSIAMNLVHLAQIDSIEGHAPAAIHRLQEVMPHFLEIGDQTNLLMSLDIVIITLTTLGEMELARSIAILVERLRRSMGIPRSAPDQPILEDAICRIGKGLNLTAGQFLETEEPMLTLTEAIDAFLALEPTGGTSGTGQGDAPGSSTVDILSAREREVLELIASGMTSSQVAEALFVSPHTVKRHMANIRSKLGVRTQAAAVASLRQGA